MLREAERVAKGAGCQCDLMVFGDTFVGGIEPGIRWFPKTKTILVTRNPDRGGR
jgi:hypothetical protein